MATRAIRCCLLAILGGLGLLLGAPLGFASPAVAAPDAPLGCFFVESEPLGFLESGALRVDNSEGIVLRSPDGLDVVAREIAVGRLATHQLRDADDRWRPVAIDNSGETVGPSCRDSQRADAPTPEPTLVWLPDAEVVGVGVRGAAEVSWDPVLDRGVAPVAYQVTVSEYDPFSPGSMPVGTYTVDGSAHSVSIEVPDANGVARRSHVWVRAWWADGVSAAAEAELPQRLPNCWVPAECAPDERWSPFEFAWPANHTAGSEAKVFMRWPTAMDDLGRPADGYQMIWGNSNDGRFAQYTVADSGFGSSGPQPARSTTIRLLQAALHCSGVFERRCR